jgi:hypothetical protein
MVMFWLGASILGLLFLGGSLVWLGWFGRQGSPPPFDLPLVWLPILDVPIAVAISGYGAAVVAVWRRRPALQPWLIGAAGHLVFLFVGALVSGGIEPAALFSFDALFGWLRFFMPGMIILILDRALLEAPPQPFRSA